MKRFVFIFSLILISSRSFSLDLFSFRGLDFYTSGTSTMRTSSPGETKICADSGFRLRLSNAVGIFSIGFPNTRLPDFPSKFSQISDWSSFDSAFDLRYGLSVKVAPKMLPVGVKILAGTLELGGGLSRLRSPNISTSSALKTFTPPTFGADASLPAFDSGEKPFAFSVKVFPSAENASVPEAEFSATCDNNFFASVHKVFSLPFVQSAGASLNFASFVYGDSGTSSWFFDERPFLDERFFSCGMEIFMLFPVAKLFVCAAASQSPFGGFSPWMRANVSVPLGRFSVNSAFYIGDGELVSVSGKRTDSWIQAQINPMGRFDIGKIKLDMGLLFQCDIKCGAGLLVDYVFRWDGSLKIGTVDLDADASYKRFGLDGGWLFSCGTDFLFRGKTFSSGASLSCKVDEKKSELSFSGNFSPKGSPVKSVGAGFSGSIRDGKLLSPEAEISLGIKRQWKFASLNAQFLFKLGF